MLGGIHRFVFGEGCFGFMLVLTKDFLLKYAILLTSDAVAGQNELLFRLNSMNSNEKVSCRAFAIRQDTRN